MSSNVSRTLLISKSVKYDRTKLIEFLDSNSHRKHDFEDCLSYLTKTDFGSVRVFVELGDQPKNYFIEHHGLDIDPDKFKGDYEMIFWVNDYQLSKKLINLFDLLVKKFFIYYIDNIKILEKRNRSHKFKRI